MNSIDDFDDFDELAQRLAVALRDHADATRAMPDLDAMRQVLHAAVVATTVGTSGTRPSPRVLAAAACSLLVLGGIVLVGGTGGRSDAAPTVVADESLMAEARRSTSPPTATITPVVPTVTVAPEPATTSVPPAPPTTIIVAPSATALTVAAVSNDLQPVPTTTAPPLTTATITVPPVPETTAPEEPHEPAPSPTTTAKPPRSTTTAKPPRSTTTVVSPATTVNPFAFTMLQKWKTSSASPPFEEFSGTAKAGATITIMSSFGGGITVVGATGAWTLRVEFPTAPVGTKFTGKVKTAQGEKTFTFKRVAA